MKVASAIILMPFVIATAMALPIVKVSNLVEERACGNPDGPCYSDPIHVARAYSPVSGGYSDINNVDLTISEADRLELEKAVKHHHKQLSEKERLEIGAASHHHQLPASKREPIFYAAMGSLLHEVDARSALDTAKALHDFVPISGQDKRELETVRRGDDDDEQAAADQIIDQIKDFIVADPELLLLG